MNYPIVVYSGIPPFALFGASRGQGSPLIIDSLTNKAYYLKGIVPTALAADGGGGGGPTAWGAITGTLSSQTDLQAALDAKSATSHTHSGVYEPADANILKTSAIGASVAAQEHTHAQLHDAVTVSDTASIDLTLTGQQISAAAIFGTTAGTVCQGSDSRLADTRAPTSHDHSANKLSQANTHETPDTDSATTSLHHTLGTGANQAAAGNHAHSGVYQPLDTQLTDLAALAYTGNTLKVVRVNSGETAFELATLAGGGDVTGQASSVDNEIALFSSTTGKVIKRATTTGILKATSGVIAAAVAGTDYNRPLVISAKLASDQATGANVTPVTLTGLVFTYEANASYRIWFMGRVSPAAATTGCGFQFDLSSAVTSIDVQFYHQLASTGTLSGGHSIADDASVGVSSGLPGTGTYTVTGAGLLITTSNTGTAQLRFRSETTAVITAKAGLTLVVERIA